jgi:CheY-like chemotaxis protein
VVFLVAEDNLRMRDSITHMLRSRVPNHHTIYEATDGCEAVELFERFHPDWVLMDVKMEPMDGIAAARAIVAAHPEANIIILTNYDDECYRRAALEAGSRWFVLKEHLADIPGMLARAGGVGP